jgi:hypothetical protein
MENETKTKLKVFNRTEADREQTQPPGRKGKKLVRRRHWGICLRLVAQKVEVKGVGM